MLEQLGLVALGAAVALVLEHAGAAILAKLKPEEQKIVAEVKSKL
jgi:hypothetical protein